jgi:hypothetical protein
MRSSRSPWRSGPYHFRSACLYGQLVEARQLADHDDPVVGADLEPADIGTHDDECSGGQGEA